MTDGGEVTGRRAAPGQRGTALLLREPARPALVREHPLAPWFAVGTVCFGAFMGQLDASVVTLAFPAMQRHFGAGLAEVQWVSLAYLLTLVALLVPVGRWSDRAGRKLVYLLGFAAFAASSAGCGLAPSLGVLIALRVVQAAAAAMLQANSVALVAASVPARARRAGLAVQAAAQALGLAAGPVAGGVLVASVGWRWIFFVNVPVGLVAVLAGWYLLPRTRQRAARKGTDPVEIGLLAAAAVTLMLAVSVLAGLGLPGWTAAVLAAAAASAWAGLAWWERRSAAPLIDLPLVASSGMLPALGGALCGYLVLFAPLVLLPQVLAAGGHGAARAGLMLVALPAGFGVAALAGERALPARWPDRRRCVAGGLLAGFGVAMLAIPAASVIWPALVLTGAGLGIYIPANNAQVMAAVPASDAAMAGGMVNMTRGLGTALGVATATLGLHSEVLVGRPDAMTLAVAALVAATAAATWAAARSGGRAGACSSPGVGEGT